MASWFDKKWQQENTNLFIKKEKIQKVPFLEIDARDALPMAQMSLEEKKCARHFYQLSPPALAA